MAEPTVKCLVWDLDDTLWDGVLLEGDRPIPFPEAIAALHELDRRGILHAAASRSDHDTALNHLTESGVEELFTTLEIGWGAKSAAVRRIAETIGIGLDTIAFVDNDPLERAEVAAALPMVRCYDATEVAKLAELAEFSPEHITEDSRRRRRFYRADRDRRVAEEEFSGPPAEFLASLDLEMTVRPATETDLARAHELTVRTNQLNTTGRTFSLDELRALCASPTHEVLVAELADRFGSYGTIGLAVSELPEGESVLQLLLMSCRVMSRGAGAALIDHLVRAALAAGRRPLAEFVPTEVNRVMLVALRFAGFAPAGKDGDRLLLAVDPDRLPQRHHHLRVHAMTKEGS